MEFSVDENRTKQSIRQERENKRDSGKQESKTSEDGFHHSQRIFTFFKVSKCECAQVSVKGVTPTLKQQRVCVGGSQDKTTVTFSALQIPDYRTCQWPHAARCFNALSAVPVRTHTDIHTLNRVLTYTLLPLYIKDCLTLLCVCWGRGGCPCG